MKYIDADRLKAEIKRIISRAMNEEGQDVCNYILSIIDSSQKYSLPEWKEHPEATNNIAMVWNTAVTPWLDWRGHRISVRSLEKLPGFDSLQQEQPDFPTTDEEVEKFLATHPKVEVPDKYKTPDWLWKKLEQPEVDIVTEYDEQFDSDPVYGKLANRNAGIAIARHFYELGRLNARKEENKGGKNNE